MANFLKLATILSLMIPSLVLALHSQMAFSSSELEDDKEDVLDSPNPSFRSRSRFLASIIKKGAHCDPIKHNICNGISANKGTSILHCCKTHCRNVLGDKNNCGKCGNKCKLGMHCCNGTCINTTFNANNCGKCGKKCKYGVKCEYGYCGYA